MLFFGTKRPLTHLVHMNILCAVYWHYATNCKFRFFSVTSRCQLELPVCKIAHSSFKQDIGFAQGHLINSPPLYPTHLHSQCYCAAPCQSFHLKGTTFSYPLPISLCLSHSSSLMLNSIGVFPLLPISYQFI